MDIRVYCYKARVMRHGWFTRQRLVAERRKLSLLSVYNTKHYAVSYTRYVRVGLLS